MFNRKYKIVRLYCDDRPTRTIKTGLTKAEAQAHCNDPKTHKVLPSGIVEWFDGWTEQ